MMDRRDFIRNSAATLATAFLLPKALVADAINPAREWMPIDGWVYLMKPCTVTSKIHGDISITRGMIETMKQGFVKPLPVFVDFEESSLTPPVGWVSAVRITDGVLQARIELPSFERPLLRSYRAVAPAFISVSRTSKGIEIGPRLVSVSLTNAPVLPDADHHL